jgi:hypothetical protein
VGIGGEGLEVGEMEVEVWITSFCLSDFFFFYKAQVRIGKL